MSFYHIFMKIHMINFNEKYILFLLNITKLKFQVFNTILHEYLHRIYEKS
jgi:hypothetical protein